LNKLITRILKKQMRVNLLNHPVYTLNVPTYIYVLYIITFQSVINENKKISTLKK